MLARLLIYAGAVLLGVLLLLEQPLPMAIAPAGGDFGPMASN
jgi:hypothetical protein